MKKNNQQEFPDFDTDMQPLSFMDGDTAKENDASESWDNIEKLSNQWSAGAEQRKIDEALAPFKTEALSNQKYVLVALKNKKELEIEVPAYIVTIGENAFAGSDVIGVTLPEGLLKIEKGAFQNCQSLEKINFPSTLRIIEDDAFAGCIALDAEAPKTVRVGKNAFQDTKPDRLAKEKAAEEKRKKDEAERQKKAAEEKARKEAEAKAAEEKRKKAEAERKKREEEERKRKEAEAKAAEERRKQEQARKEAEAKAAEERRKQEQARKEAAEKEAIKRYQDKKAEIQNTIRRLSQEKKHNDDWYYQIDQVEKSLEANGINPRHLDETERNLLSKLYDAYNKKVKHNKAKDGLLEWLKDYAAIALAVIFAVCAVVFVFLASRTFAIMALCAGVLSIVAAIIAIHQDEYDELSIHVISIVVSGIFMVVALIQWFFAFGVSDFIIKDGVLKDYYGNKQVVEVPDGIVEIKDSAFWHTFNGNGKVERVILPEGVKSIGADAFHGCRSLAEINLPESLKTISSNAFYNCVSLETISMPDSVQVIGACAFEACPRLREVYIGSGVKEIGESAFKDCTFLETIYYNGTEAEWNAITKADGSGWFEDAWDANTGNYTVVFLK